MTLITAAALLLLQETKFKFTPVDDKSTKVATWLTDAVKVVPARLKAIGYDNAKATVDVPSRTLTVTIPKDVQGADRQTVYAVCSRQGNLELRLQKQLGLLEREEFKAPKAPKGCKWYKTNHNFPLAPLNGDEGSVLGLEKAEALTRKDFGSIEKGGEGELLFAPNEAAIKKLVKLGADNDKNCLYFCVDGEVLGWHILSAAHGEADYKQLKTTHFDAKATPLALAVLNGGAMSAPFRAKD